MLVGHGNSVLACLTSSGSLLTVCVLTLLCPGRTAEAGTCNGVPLSAVFVLLSPSVRNRSARCGVTLYAWAARRSIVGEATDECPSPQINVPGGGEEVEGRCPCIATEDEQAHDVLQTSPSAYRIIP